MFWNFLSVIESSFSGFWGPKIFQLASFAMPRFFVAIAMHPTTIPTVLGAVEEFGPEEFDVSKNVGAGRETARQVKLLKVIFWKNPKRSKCNYSFQP